ncbi:hypothetical protein LJB42_003624 [Komagataella kurtzmanii]|nr:hypothetical protein LJB42_003624 [Komagataella kurtzmanii]
METPSYPLKAKTKDEGEIIVRDIILTNHEETQGHSSAVDRFSIVDDHDSRTSQNSPESLDLIFEVDAEEDFPDGGWDAWLVVIGALCGCTPILGLINSIGPIESYISTHQLEETSTTVIAWIFSIFTAVGYMSGILVGVLVDEFGVKIPMLVGSIFHLMGLVATAECKTVYQFILAFSVCTGMGTSLCLTSNMAVIPHWFKRNKAKATGIATIGGSLGGVVFPLMMKSLYDKVGFQWTMRIVGLVCFALNMMAFFLIKTRLSGKTGVFDIPEFDQNGQKFSFVRKSWLRFEQFSVYVTKLIDFKAFKEAKYTCCVIAFALSELMLVCCMTYLMSYFIKRGHSSATAFNMIIIVNATGILGRFVPGIAADRYGVYNVMIGMLVTLGIVQFVLWLSLGQHLWSLYTFSVLFGFFSASVLSLSPVCLSAISPTKDFAKRFSTAFLVVGFVSLMGLPIGGAIIDNASISNYNNFIVYTGILCAASSVFWALTRYAIRRTWKINIKV